MTRHSTLFITHRGLTHQQAALNAAPPELDITMVRTPSKQEIIDLLPGREILISERSGEIDADIIAAGKDLRLIQRLGSQTWDIDLPAARQAGIPVCYLPVLTCVNVAEHMMLQMLGLAKRLREVETITIEAGDWGMPPKKCDEDYFAYNWSAREDIRSLYGSTVGIVGMGEIGAELARRLRNFDCRVLYNKRNPLPAGAEEELQVEFAAMDDLLAQSDFVCLLLPLFPETEGIVNKAFIQKMKRGAILVSCGASGILNEAEVCDALEAGDLYGLATDTYAWEPIRDDNPLLRLARQKSTNILLTPHTAAGTVAARPEERQRDYRNILRLLNGQPLANRLA